MLKRPIFVAITTHGTYASFTTCSIDHDPGVLIETTPSQAIQVLPPVKLDGYLGRANAKESGNGACELVRIKEISVRTATL